MPISTEFYNTFEVEILKDWDELILTFKINFTIPILTEILKNDTV